MTPVTAADLFCGAGGTSSGLMAACRELGMPIELLALNHWNVAISTHQRNHPGVRHLWADIEGIDPRQVVPSGYLRLLVASPECVFFSRARGGKPINDQRRSSASYVLDWARKLRIDDLLIENVQEFADWGPIHPENHPDKTKRLRPIHDKKGIFFEQFCGELRDLGYTVEHRVLNAADYGDATTRERLFVRARRSGNITWPEPTHQTCRRPAKEIIDWSTPGKSIYNRKQKLVPATMRRILSGVRKFSGLAPFLVEYHGDHPGTNSSERRTRSIDEPLATQDTSNRFGLVQPFLACVNHSGNEDRAYSVNEPLKTLTSKGSFGACQPYLVVFRNHADSLPMDAPLPALCANGQHFGLATPYLVNNKGKSQAANLSFPMPTQTAHAPHLALAQPCLTEYYGTGAAKSVEVPLSTITTHDRFGLSQPVITAGNEYLLEALKDPDPLYRPLIAVIDGVEYLVDILYRMLFPRELAAAMSFPGHYQFTGTQSDQVKQIGNSVPVELAKALCLSILQ